MACQAAHAAHPHADARGTRAGAIAQVGLGTPASPEELRLGHLLGPDSEELRRDAETTRKARRSRKEGIAACTGRRARRPATSESAPAADNIWERTEY